MNNITHLFKMDFFTIKPYITLKNIIIYLVIVLFLSLSNRSALTGAMMFMFFVSLFATYPFIVGDQNDLDFLYSILGLDRKEVVNSRYYFMLIMNLLGFIAANLIAMITSLAMGLTTPIFEYTPALTALALVILFSQLIQFPFFFKLGYTKAKLYSYLPYIIIALAFIGLASFGEQIDKSNGFHQLKLVLTVIGDNPSIAFTVI